MQFPRYEFMLPPPAPPGRLRLESQPRPRPVRPARRLRPGLSVVRAIRGRRPAPAAAETELDIQQYLALEFPVDERR